MFGIHKNELIENLEKLRKYICCYASSTNFCDCKYGCEFSNPGEKTGCPEVRMAIKILTTMTDDEFKNLCKRAKISI